MLKIGHRGAPRYAPENTLAGFRKALALGADGVELDVHRCKSGELVVIHDDTVDRTLAGSGAVADMTLSQLQSLKGRQGESIPTLDDALRALGAASCFIEIKHPDAALPAADEMARYIKKGKAEASLWLISFHHEALTRALRAYPWLNVGASFENLTSSSIREAHRLGARAIIPHYAAIGPEHVKEAHRLGLKVICWTVNDPSDIARLIRLGVDGIMSDAPDLLGER